MRKTVLSVSDVFIIDTALFDDQRGFFFESYSAKDFNESVGREINFVQDNHSHSVRNVLRGLHYQIRQPQGKLIRVVSGEVFDVAVDLRRSSPTYGKWVAAVLSAENKKQMWIPEGFAHGFVVTSDAAELLYKTTDYYAPEHERCIAWDDPIIGVQWPLDGAPILSAKDQRGVPLALAEVFP